jgi:hypothetical protein
VVIAESNPTPTTGAPTARKGAAVQSIATVAQGGKGAEATFQVWVVCTKFP